MRLRMMLLLPLMRRLRAMPHLRMHRTVALRCRQLPLVILLPHRVLTPPQLPLANPPRIQPFHRRLTQRRILKSQTSNSALILRCERIHAHGRCTCITYCSMN